MVSVDRLFSSASTAKKQSVQQRYPAHRHEGIYTFLFCLAIFELVPKIRFTRSTMSLKGSLYSGRLVRNVSGRDGADVRR